MNKDHIEESFNNIMGNPIGILDKLIEETKTLKKYQQKRKITAIEAEILEERGREVEWSGRQDWIEVEEKSLLDRIDEHIVNQNEEV